MVLVCHMILQDHLTNVVQKRDSTCSRWKARGTSLHAVKAGTAEKFTKDFASSSENSARKEEEKKEDGAKLFALHPNAIRFTHLRP